MGTGGAIGPDALPAALRDRFRPRRILGAGGCGTVFLCEDTELGRQVAIKLFTMRKERRKHLRRFREEAKLAAGLSHPNLVEVHDAEATDADAAYIVYEYVPGRDLAAILRKDGPFPRARWLELGRVVAEALGCLHDAGIIHRDVKPANILLREDGVAFLCDLGLVRDLDREGMRTTTGVIQGTPFYLGPEIWNGARATFATDQFALGATLAELATGEKAYPCRSAADLFAFARKGGDLRLPEEFRRADPAATAVLERLLARDPADRYADIGEVAAALRELEASPPAPVEGPAAPPPEGLEASRIPAPAPAPPPPASRSRIPWAAVGVVVALAGALAATRGPGSVPASPGTPPVATTTSPEVDEEAAARAAATAAIEDLWERHGPLPPEGMDLTAHVDALPADFFDAAFPLRWNRTLDAIEAWAASLPSFGGGAPEPARVAFVLDSILGKISHVMVDCIRLGRRARNASMDILQADSGFSVQEWDAQLELWKEAEGRTQEAVARLVARGPSPPVDVLLVELRLAALSRWPGSPAVLSMGLDAWERGASASLEPHFSRALGSLLQHPRIGDFTGCSPRREAVERILARPPGSPGDEAYLLLACDEVREQCPGILGDATEAELARRRAAVGDPE